ncbi:MAG: PKD domain-containing protein [Flavobacteriales bacterium]
MLRTTRSSLRTLRSWPLVLGAGLLFHVAQAQVPAKCFEIESILADACNGGCTGATEGENEMVRFITGPDPIAIGDIRVSWPNNSFQGLIQNATTASLVDQLNATISSCGHLLEPPGGIIPPGKRVVMVTSTAMCVASNSFANLSDTLYMIFQKAGNTAGHFANFGSGTRTLTMTYVPTGCNDAVTYDRALLVDQNGIPGAQDGGTANFSWPGTPVVTYTNDGCQAPIIPLEVRIVSGGGDIPCGSPTTLVGGISGAARSYHWSGGNGTFSDPAALTTTYTPGPGDNGTFELSLCATSSCGDDVCAQVSVTVRGPHVTVSGDTTLCGQFETSVLTASGADTYLWSTGATGPSITAAISGPISYWVVGTTACGSDTAHISPRWMSATTYYQNISCTGAADGELSVEPKYGVSPYTYLWSTGSTDSLITGLAPGHYTCTITDADGCTRTGQGNISEPPPLTLTMGNDTTICPGGYAVLIANGGGGRPAYTLTWSPEGPLVHPTATTTYSVVIKDQNGCTLPAQTLTVNVAGDTASFTTSATEGCAPLCVTFTATSAATTYDWQFSDGGTASGGVVQHCFQTEGSYDVSLIGTIAGTDCPTHVTMEDLVHVLPTPVADFTASPTTGEAPLTVRFNDTTTPPGADLHWSFGDQTSSNDPDPMHTYASPGVYMVVLEATSGCSNRDTAYIRVIEPGQVVDSSWVRVPNVFSPNGDGHNDGFRIGSEGLSSLSVLIFNRWGQQVAAIRNEGEAWTGRSDAGETLSEGTYFYTLKATGVDGRTYDLHGAVTLLR